MKNLIKLILCPIGFIIIKVRNLNYKLIGIYNTNAVNNKGGKISGKTFISNPKNIYIGKGSSINGGYLFAGKKSKIIIGDNTIISYNVHIRANTHNYDRVDTPIKNQGETDKDIIIGDECWIGFGAQIMPGVTIGKGAIVGAGAIVTHNVNDYETVAGVPARVINKRASKKTND